MCGILGWIDYGKSVSDSLFNQALNHLAKRGPDYQAIYRHQRTCLGHARLSIIDLSAAANQPIFDKTGRYAIIFNGEIFNYQELRHKLTQFGIQLQTNSDTEILLYLFIQYGESCLSFLNGFFAFAIYDHQTHDLFIARDRFGIKPLKYFQDESYFAFSSEMKALLALPLPRLLNIDAVNLYFQYSYLPPGVSMLQGFKQLLPGECLWVRNGQVQVNRWYELPRPSLSNSKETVSYQEAQHKLLNLLEDAVQKRLIADVPVGVFLSGGIDSSIVTALAARNQKKLSTFSISFDNPLYDERKYALAVAKKYQTEHTIFEVQTEDLFSCVSDVLDYLDEPFADSSALNFFILARQTRQKVVAALSGDGADEVFAGYTKHVGLLKAGQNSLVNNILRFSQPILRKLPANRNSSLGRILYQITKYAEGLPLPAAERYLAWCRIAAQQEVTQILQPKFQSLNSNAAILKTKITDNQDFNDILAADVQLVLAGDMLVKADLMSMANSLEVRVPFLDYRVVEFAFSLPANYKIQGTQRKRILQDTFRDLLPSELYNRPKQGFEVPLRDWFLGPYRTTIEKNILNKNIIESQGIFQYPAIMRLWNNILLGKNTKEDCTLWAFIVFQHWYHRYISQP